MSKENSNADLSAKYLHTQDKRSEKEKMLSDNIVRNLSELNLQRMRKKQSDPEPFQYSEQYFFLCLTGIPPFPNEYENLQLPGQKVIYSLTGFIGNKTQEQYMKMVQEVTLESQAKKISQIINAVPSNKKIIIVFHSFGTFIVAGYFHLFDHSRIFGLIDIGGVPITMYKVLNAILMNFAVMKFSDIVENLDMAYKSYVQYAKSEKFVPLQNKYQMLIFLKVVQGAAFYQIFEWIRNYPNILKLIVSGQRDVFFAESLLNEKAVYYSYVKRLDSDYETRLKTAYSKFYGSEVKNVQERFLLSFEKGKHSVHCQPNLVPDIKNAIKQYIGILELAHQLANSQK